MISVTNVQWTDDGQSARLAANVVGAGATQELWFEMPSGTPRPPAPGNAFLCAVLKPAMHLGLPLRVEAPCDPELRRAAVEEIQPIYRFWVPSLTQVELVDGPPADPNDSTGAADSAGAGRGVGVFFSGGVDSLYSYLRFREETTHLVPVHGFDVPVEDDDRWTMVMDEIRRVADRTDVSILPVRTNLRHFSDRIATWPLYHGGALAAVAHATAGCLGRIRIGSTHTYDEPFAWGSHPLLDHHWSSGGLDVRHDGAGATRFHKIERIAGDAVALETLRVCFKSRTGRLNCGRCAKCVRTMVSLAILGRLGETDAFEGTLDEATIAGLPINDENERSFARENLAAAHRLGSEAWIVRGLERAIASSHSSTRRLHPKSLARAAYGKLPVAAQYRIRRLLKR